MKTKDIYTVKLTPYRESLASIMFRQTKGEKGFSSDGRYRFIIDDNLTEDVDFWVVQGKGLRTSTTVNVSPKNTILLTTEPSSVLRYPKDYINQFALVCSCQEDMKHRNLMYGPAILPWFIGFSEDRDGKVSYSIKYDDLKNTQPHKTKLLSVITSNKAFTKGHLDRIRFVEKLKDYYGDQIDIFGRGYNDFDDKWDVLAPYKYHIVIENSSQNYYWTEKISDCFLAETYPFYYGCTNLEDYFPSSSFSYIDIYNFKKSVSIIDSAIKEELYSKSQEILLHSKSLALEKYNMFDYIASLCDNLDPLSIKGQVTLHPCNTLHNWHNFYNYVIGRNLFKIQQKVKNLLQHSTLSNK